MCYFKFKNFLKRNTMDKNTIDKLFSNKINDLTKDEKTKLLNIKINYKIIKQN